MGMPDQPLIAHRHDVDAVLVVADGEADELFEAAGVVPGRLRRLTVSRKL